MAGPGVGELCGLTAAVAVIGGALERAVELAVADGCGAADELVAVTGVVEIVSASELLPLCPAAAALPEAAPAVPWFAT